MVRYKLVLSYCKDISISIFIMLKSFNLEDLSACSSFEYKSRDGLVKLVL